MSQITKLSDEKLVELIRTENQELFAEIIKRYQGKLQRYAKYLLNDDQRAADAVQQGFIKAYINLQGFNIQRKFSSWLYRIVHNEVVNLYRRPQHQSLIDDFVADEQLDLTEEVIKKEIISRAHHCLAELPLIYSEPLSLFYLENKSYQEISDILRLPAGTVATRINRAKKMMKIICQKIKK